MATAGKSLAIGALARLADCSVDTVRYYEGLGLLPHVPRGPGGHRQYGGEHVRRLRFIRRTRDLGLSLAQVRGLIVRTGGAAYDCGEVRLLFGAQMADVRRRISELKDLEQTLQALLQGCSDAELSNCRVIEAMLSGEAQPTAVCCSGVADA